MTPKNYFDYSIPPIERLYDELEHGWNWTLMIAQPEFVTKAVIQRAVDALVARKKAIPARVRLESFREGDSCQTLHLGTYDSEQSAIDLLHKYIANHGYDIVGRHHEIYLNDPRRVSPEKIKTLIRYPVRK